MSGFDAARFRRGGQCQRARQDLACPGAERRALACTGDAGGPEVADVDTDRGEGPPVELVCRRPSRFSRDAEQVGAGRLVQYGEQQVLGADSPVTKLSSLLNGSRTAERAVAVNLSNMSASLPVLGVYRLPRHPKRVADLLPRPAFATSQFDVHGLDVFREASQGADGALVRVSTRWQVG